MKKRMDFNFKVENYEDGCKLVTVEDAFQEFQNSNYAKNLAQPSIAFYNNCYKAFISYFDPKKLCKEINKKVVEDFLRVYKEKSDVKATSMNSYTRGLRAFFYYCMELGYMERFKITLMRAEKQLKPTYTEEEQDILLKRKKFSKFTDYRDWVMVCYLLATGNRLNTISNLKIKDIDFYNSVIYLRVVKNKKSYAIPMSDTLGGILKEYVKIRNGQPEDFLFCSTYGTQLKTSSIQTCIKRYNLSRGIAKTSVHRFRHTFAKDWVVSGGSELKLQKILGHSSLAMVREYVELFDEDLKIDFNNHNSLEKHKGIVQQKKAIKPQRSY